MDHQPSFPDCACFNLRRAARLVTQLYDRRLAPSGLKATQFTLLAMIAGAGKGITITELAGRLGTDRTTLTRNLRIVEKERLVRIDPGDDRRERIVVITEEGRRRLAEAAPLWRQAQLEVTGRFDEEDWSGLLAMLRKVSSFDTHPD